MTLRRWVARGRPKLRRVRLAPHKTIALCIVTAELAEDATALEGTLTNGFSKEMGFVTENLIINGSGVKRILGILSSSANRITVSKETNQGAARPAAAYGQA